MKPGTFVAIPLPNGRFGVGRVLKSPLMAFYSIELDHFPLESEISSIDLIVAFAVWVHRSAIGKRGWQKIGFREISGNEPDPFFFRQDAISRKLYLHRNGQERLATFDEVESLEVAAVYDHHHVEDRLDAFLLKRPKPQWVRSPQRIQ